MPKPALKLIQDGAQSLEPIRPVGLLYCVDAEHIQSAIELEMCEKSKFAK